MILWSDSLNTFLIQTLIHVLHLHHDLLKTKRDISKQISSRKKLKLNILITFFVFNNVPVYFLGHDFLLDFTLLPILELRIWVWNLYFYIVRAKIQSCLFKSISKYCSNTLIRSVAIKFILNLRINLKDTNNLPSFFLPVEIAPSLFSMSRFHFGLFPFLSMSK